MLRVCRSCEREAYGLNGRGMHDHERPSLPNIKGGQTTRRARPRETKQPRFKTSHRRCALQHHVCNRRRTSPTGRENTPLYSTFQSTAP